MENSIFEEPNENVIEYKLLAAYNYWVGKLLLFNILVGFSGLASIALFSGFRLSAFEYFGILCWGVMANILYSVGYVIESVVIVSFKGEKSFAKLRGVLFWIGAIGYMLASAGFALSYFLKPMA